jgi:hypothetical protein
VNAKTNDTIQNSADVRLPHPSINGGMATSHTVSTTPILQTRLRQRFGGRHRRDRSTTGLGWWDSQPNVQRANRFRRLFRRHISGTSRLVEARTDG